MPRRTIPITTERNPEGLHLDTILVPCDFSASSEHAFHWAVGLAEDWEAQIVVLHVIPVFFPVDDLQAQFLVDLPQVEIALFSGTKTRLEECTTQKTNSTVPVETRVVMGDAWWEICRTAEREPADLIVIGSHGDTGIARIPLGSVAERVVRHAPCPVLVVRLPGQKPFSERTSTGRENS
jgi:nucleotide-binding universal stress UspA family protein